MKAFKSGKKRRDELRAARQRRQQRRVQRLVASASAAMPAGLAAGPVPVDPARLQPNNSYGQPDFLCRGFYQDIAFRCIDCGAEGVWTAERQRWWYEVAGGDIYTTARRCAPCRAAERQRKAAARQRSLAGWFAKLAALSA